MLWFKVLADLIANTTRAAVSGAGKDLFAGICFPAAEPVDTEVKGIVETAFLPRIGDPVAKDLIRNGRRILAQIFGNGTKGSAFIQCLLNICSVLQRKVFVITRY